MAKDWIQSIAGKMVFPRDLRPEQVSFDDIVAALSKRPRFSGQTHGGPLCLELKYEGKPSITCPILPDWYGYSVAQHCILGARGFAPLSSWTVARVDFELALAFLLHEVSEVYLPDIPSPLKPHVYVDTGEGVIPWHELEARHANAVLEALDLEELRPLLDAPEIKRMDLAMLATEKRDLMGEPPAPWNLVVPARDDLEITKVWAAGAAAAEFRQMYSDLREGLGL